MNFPQIPNALALLSPQPQAQPPAQQQHRFAPSPNEPLGPFGPNGGAHFGMGASLGGLKQGDPSQLAQYWNHGGFPSFLDAINPHNLFPNYPFGGGGPVMTPGGGTSGAPLQGNPANALAPQPQLSPNPAPNYQLPTY